jgi:hypothetical protein
MSHAEMKEDSPLNPYLLFRVDRGFDFATDVFGRRRLIAASGHLSGQVSLPV